MFTHMRVQPLPLERYAEFLDQDQRAELERLAAQLRGARILHLNTTAFSTRVADMIGTLTGLTLGLGIVSEWQVLPMTARFAEAYQAMYGALQSPNAPWDPGLTLQWFEYNATIAALFDQEYDYVIVHDPQPAGILNNITKHNGKRPPGKWIWHCHLDLRQANPEVRELIAGRANAYDAVLAEMGSYLDGGGFPTARIVLPSIDPLSPRNYEISPETTQAMMCYRGFDECRPLVSQVSHLEPAVYPLGLLAAYRLARQEVPNLQLLLAFPTVGRDSASQQLFFNILRECERDPDIHVLWPLDGLGSLDVNVFQRASTIAVQKSIGKGFGLVAAEAMWKGKPVIAPRQGGIPMQVLDGQTGFLADDVEVFAEKMVYLLQNPDGAAAMGSRAKEHVRENFLITRYLRDYLALLVSVR